MSRINSSFSSEERFGWNSAKGLLAGIPEPDGTLSYHARQPPAKLREILYPRPSLLGDGQPLMESGHDRYYPYSWWAAQLVFYDLPVAYDRQHAQRILRYTMEHGRLEMPHRLVLVEARLQRQDSAFRHPYPRPQFHPHPLPLSLPPRPPLTATTATLATEGRVEGQNRKIRNDAVNVLHGRADVPAKNDFTRSASSVARKIETPNTVSKRATRDVTFERTYVSMNDKAGYAAGRKIGSANPTPRSATPCVTHERTYLPMDDRFSHSVGRMVGTVDSAPSRTTQDVIHDRTYIPVNDDTAHSSGRKIKAADPGPRKTTQSVTHDRAYMLESEDAEDLVRRRVETADPLPRRTTQSVAHDNIHIPVNDDTASSVRQKIETADATSRRATQSVTHERTYLPVENQSAHSVGRRIETANPIPGEMQAMIVNQPVNDHALHERQLKFGHDRKLDELQLRDNQNSMTLNRVVPSHADKDPRANFEDLHSYRAAPDRSKLLQGPMKEPVNKRGHQTQDFRGENRTSEVQQPQEYATSWTQHFNAPVGYQSQIKHGDTSLLTKNPPLHAPPRVPRWEPYPEGRPRHQNQSSQISQEVLCQESQEPEYPHIRDQHDHNSKPLGLSLTNSIPLKRRDGKDQASEKPPVSGLQVGHGSVHRPTPASDSYQQASYNEGIDGGHLGSHHSVSHRRPDYAPSLQATNDYASYRPNQTLGENGNADKQAQSTIQPDVQVEIRYEKHPSIAHYGVLPFSSSAAEVKVRPQKGLGNKQSVHHSRRRLIQPRNVTGIQNFHEPEAEKSSRRHKRKAHNRKDQKKKNLKVESPSPSPGPLGEPPQKKKKKNKNKKKQE